MNPAVSIVMRFIIFLTIIAAGAAGLRYLTLSKKDPAQAEIAEQVLHVNVLPVTFSDVSVAIEGFGQVRSRDVVAIAPEVPGKVVFMHPKLEAGEIIPANEVLFEVDPRDYQARVDESTASLKQLNHSITRLNKQLRIDTQRLETFKRSRTLAKDEFGRLKKLYDNDKVGTQSQVDGAELAYNQANDAYDQLALSLELSPIRIEEAKNTLGSATAMAKLATTNLERCKVTVPFAARVKTVSVEKGQYVAPGQPILTLANDSILEISIPIDSKQARTWLVFDDSDTPSSWFENLTQVPVQVKWTEEHNSPIWKGRLDRVEKFDPSTRTLSLIVQIPAKDAVSPASGTLPLVEGMFCKVTIPGKIAKHVAEIPVECVSFGKDSNGYRSIFIAKADPKNPDEIRLNTIKVLESHIKDDSIFIQEGLTGGDLVVVTRLINPLKNSLLKTNLIETVEPN